MATAAPTSSPARDRAAARTSASGAAWTSHEIGGFFAYNPAFPGGVSVAAGDVDGDGRADIITGAGPGGGPHVRVWSGADFHEIGGFFAYDPAFTGGVCVAAGDVNDDGRADIITGAGPGGGPHVRVWNATNFAEIGGFFAYDPAFTGGVQVRRDRSDGRRPRRDHHRCRAGRPPDLEHLERRRPGAPRELLRVRPERPRWRLHRIGRQEQRAALHQQQCDVVHRRGVRHLHGDDGWRRNGAGPDSHGALPAGVTFTDNGNRTATLAGIPAPEPPARIP